MKVILLRLVYVTIGMIALGIAFMGGRSSTEGTSDSSLFFATAMVVLLSSLILARADGRKFGKE